MNESFIIDREFLFKTSIHEITSISLEDNYDINGSNIEGEFIISGDYRLHEISINKEDFSFKVPFKHEISRNINLDSIELEITDFSYDFKNEDELSVHIEYIINGEEGIIEFADGKSLDDFLENTDVEIVDLSEDNIIEEKNDSQLIDDNKEDDRQMFMEDDSNIEETDSQDIVEDNNVEEISNEKIDHNMILNSINSKESYVKYHVHTVTLEDTIESICTKYNTNINTIKKYNTFEVLELNMKLLIPENEEN